MIFKMISDVSTRPFMINELANGIQLILLKFMFLRSEILIAKRAQSFEHRVSMVRLQVMKVSSILSVAHGILLFAHLQSTVLFVLFIGILRLT